MRSVVLAQQTCHGVQTAKFEGEVAKEYFCTQAGVTVTSVA